jgi:hypothetical protein
MGIVARIINSMLRFNVGSYETGNIKIEIDAEGCISKFSVDECIILDEEDSIILGPLFWKELLCRYGRKVEMTDDYSLCFVDSSFKYDIHKRKNINIFMAYHFTNTFIHENINPIIDIAVASRPMAYVTVRKKGDHVDKLDKQGLIEVVKALSFLHDNNVVFLGVYPNCLTKINGKVMLDDFTNTIRSKEDFNKDICMLGYFINESFPLLSYNMINGKLNMKGILQELKEENKEEKKQVIYSCRYYPKEFPYKYSNLVNYIKEYSHNKYKHKINVEDTLHLLNRIVHSFTEDKLESLCKAISYLLAFYYGYAFTYEEIDHNIFSNILCIISMTKGYLFYSNNPT